MRYFEDLQVGRETSFGSYEVSGAEIVEFGEQYDPQPMHVDESKAAESMFGGLVASGWHTAAVTMRLVVDNYLSTSAALGSPGVEELRWHEPVRPGDELRVETEILDKRPTASDPDRGLVTVAVTTLNQDDTPVMSMNASIFWARRDGTGE